MTEPLDTPSQIATPKEGAPAHRPPQCERFPACIFFNDKMANMPETAEATKDDFCRGNFPRCARYIIQSVWKLKAPEDLFPYQLGRAQAILDASISDRCAGEPSTEALAIANRTIHLLTSTLGHGFFMFDKTGVCAPIYSNACEGLLEITPAGKSIAEVLRLDAKQRETMNTALRLVFSHAHAMSFDEIMHFAPKVYHHSSGAHIRIEYKPDRLPDDTVDRIVVVATDITEQLHVKEAAEERKALFESLERIFHDRSFFGAYMRRLREALEALEPNGPHLPWETLQREIHTLKGDSGIFRLTKIMSLLHEFETAFKPFVAAGPTLVPPAGDPCFAVLAPFRDQMKNEVAALSTYLKDLLGIDITKVESERSFDKEVLYAFAKTLADRGLTDLTQTYIRTVCAESLTAYLRRFDFILADLATRLNKKVNPLRFVGTDIPVMIDLYRDFLDSFAHLFRNSLDHGIESPNRRVDEGKDEAATIEIKMNLRDGSNGTQILHLEILDDGAGIATERLRTKLAEREPGNNWETRDEKEILEAVLTHNISSRDTATLYSGRGVGMGAVYAEVIKRSGHMSLTSFPGKGTRTTIDIPYRLEIPQA